jgi:hypothetical protein
MTETRIREYEKGKTAPQVKSSCGVCKSCWIWAGGPRLGRCDYGGPYRGYWDTETKSLKTLDKSGS